MLGDSTAILKPILNNVSLLSDILVILAVVHMLLLLHKDGSQIWMDEV